MKVDFSKAIEDFDGNAIKRKTATGEVDWKLGDVAAEALMQQEQGGLTTPELLDRFRLAQKVSKGGEVELTVEEARQIQSLAAKTLMPLFSGNLVAAIEAAAGA